MSILYRDATIHDVNLIMKFIEDLAEYEKLAHEVVADTDVLAEQMFGAHPRAFAMIAEVQNKPVGFALYFYNFSTFLGRSGLYIEDLYVEPAYRGQGIGKGFFRELAKKAQVEKCGRIEWWVLDWNKQAIDVYESMGVKAMDEWIVYRLNHENIEKLAN